MKGRFLAPCPQKALMNTHHQYISFISRHNLPYQPMNVVNLFLKGRFIPGKLPGTVGALKPYLNSMNLLNFEVNSPWGVGLSYFTNMKSLKSYGLFLVQPWDGPAIRSQSKTTGRYGVANS